MSGIIVPRSPEWYAARRLGVTSTDIVAILGLSRYRSEGDIARSKAATDDEPDDDMRRRLGRALEDVIRSEDELAHGIKLRRVRRFVVDPDRPLLRTSLDFERVGERTIVEAKSSTSRGRFEDGLPEDVEAQVQWQMGVARYPLAHVAALRFGSTLVCYDVPFDAAMFDGMVTIAEEFWSRYLAGGPFSESRASTGRAWPLDDGSTMVADAALSEAVQALAETRSTIKRLETQRDDLEVAIQTRMATATTLTGDGFRVTWKRTKDRTEVDYKTLKADHPDLVAEYTSTRPGTRQFLVKMENER